MSDMEERLDEMEEHLNHLAAQGKDVEIDIARIHGMRRTLNLNSEIDGARR